MGAGPLCKSQHNYTCHSVALSHHNLPGWRWWTLYPNWTPCTESWTPCSWEIIGSVSSWRYKEGGDDITSALSNFFNYRGHIFHRLVSQFCVTFSIDWCHNSPTKFLQLLIQSTAHFWHNLHLVLRLCLVVWCVFSCVYLDTFCIYTVNTTLHSTLATWPPLVSRLYTSCSHPN